MITTLTKENFEQEVLQAKGQVLVDFWASWCGPCKMIAPEVEAVAAEKSDLKVCKLNIDEQAELAIQYGVMSIPTLIVFEDGKQGATAVGYRKKDEILALLG